MHRAIAVAEVSPGVQSLLKRGFPFAVREYQLKLNQLIPFLPEVRSISGNKPNIVYNAVTFDSREVRPGAIYVTKISAESAFGDALQIFSAGVA